MLKNLFGHILDCLMIWNGQYRSRSIRTSGWNQAWSYECLGLSTKQIPRLNWQVLAYLLISASSSAATRVDDWQSNWGKDEFTEMASASIGMSFLTFAAFALSSIISGYNLCNRNIAWYWTGLYNGERKQAGGVNANQFLCCVHCTKTRWKVLQY